MGLREPVVERGLSYTHGLKMKAKEGTSYVLRAQPAKGRALRGDFSPPVVVKKISER